MKTKRMISFVIALAMIVSLFAVVPVSAEVDVASCGKMYTTTDSNPYGQLASAVKFADGATSVLAQTIETESDIVAIDFGCWGSGTLDINFYSYSTDIATSLAGVPVSVLKGVTFSQGQGQADTTASDVYLLSEVLSAGKYVVEFTNSSSSGLHLAVGTSLYDGAESYGSGLDGNVAGIGTGAVCFTVYVDGTVAPVLSSASQITAGETKLTQNITGKLSVSSGNYVIDLAGKTWNAGSEVAVEVRGNANVTIKDSVGEGKITSGNDAIDIGPEDGSSNPTVVVNGITVESTGSSGDAFFVNCGTVDIINCTLYANKAGIDVSQNASSATINVNGCKFAGAPTGGDRTCAIEFRNNGKVVNLSGDINFENNIIMRRNECTVSLDTVIKTGENSTVAFGADGSVKNYESSYTQNTITYTYTPVPSFDSYSVTLGTDLALNFYVNNATETTEVKFEANGEELEYALGEDGAYVLVFGPHQTATEVTATLIVDGETVDTEVASIDGYLNQLKEDKPVYSEKVDAIQMYTKASELYIQLVPDDDFMKEVETLYADCAPTNNFDIISVSSTDVNSWKSATLILEDDIKIRLTTDLTEGEVKVIDVTGEEVDTLTISQDGTVEFSVTPGNIYTTYRFDMYDADGMIVSSSLQYSVDSYIVRILASNEAYPVELDTLLMSIAIYGDAFLGQ